MRTRHTRSFPGLAMMAWLFATLPLLSMGCATPAPSGWGDDAWGEAAQIASRVGAPSNAEWQDSWVGEGFESCIVGDTDAYGLRGTLTLFRRGSALEGYSLSFSAVPDQDALQRAVITDFDLPEDAASEPIYMTWSDGEAVHLESEGTAATLTVAGPAFGTAFQAALLRSGLGHLGDGMRPH